MFACGQVRVSFMLAAGLIALPLLGCESTGTSRTEVTVGAFEGEEPPAGMAVRYNAATGRWEAAKSDHLTLYYDQIQDEWRPIYAPSEAEFRPITPAGSEEARRLGNLKPASPEDSLLLHGQ